MFDTVPDGAAQFEGQKIDIVYADYFRRVREIAATGLVKASKVSQPAVSQHLRALRDAGLVTERRDGRHIRYRVASKGLTPLFDWLGHYRTFWDERFENLEQLLKETE